MALSAGLKSKAMTLTAARLNPSHNGENKMTISELRIIYDLASESFVSAQSMLERGRLYGNREMFISASDFQKIVAAKYEAWLNWTCA